jgi:pyruvate ferredoxin oxidoreductase alpha subunit
MIRDMMMGSDAVAYGVKLAKPDVICAYPITPQTHIVETLSELAPSWGGRFINVESEFSALATCFGAVCAGSRAFTATSSHGLFLMHEVLHYFSGARMPLVLVNVNRAPGMPWNIWADQSDSMAQRDTGWLQIYCETCQEALDSILQGYFVSEKVLLPVMVMIDGFILSHTMEEVEIHDQEKIDAFLLPYEPKFKLDVDDPHSFGNATLPDDYYRMRKDLQAAFENSYAILTECHRKFQDEVGPAYDFIEAYRCEDAEIMLILSGALTGTVRVAVDLMRNQGIPTGLVKIRVFRPFPKEALRQVLDKCQKAIVLNRAVSYGAEGSLTQEIKSALYDAQNRPEIYDLVVSLGGKEVFPDTLIYIVEQIQKNPSVKNAMVWL